MRVLAVLILLAILAGGILFGYKTLFDPKPVAQPMTASQTEKNAASFDQKVDSLRPKNGSKQPISVELTQEEVTAKVTQALSAAPGGEKPIKNVAVTVQQDTAVVSGTASLGGQEIPVEAQVKVGADGGLLDVDVTSLKAAGLPVPEPMKEQIMEKAKAAMGGKDLNGLDVGIDLKRVKLVDGKILIDGQTR